ncbi:MAG: sialate O-acetylesterase [Planctomycetia bacterium]|nr:sialate O-acetylesterase [Planctomycetia bacterium]
MSGPRAWMAAVALVAGVSSTAQADVKLPNVFGDHMVLQQGQKNKVWGLADAGEDVTVSIDAQNHKAKAGANGEWHVMLDPRKVGGPYALTVKGKNEVKFEDVLVGEVWICSGQSNMQWSVNASNDPDLERATAKYPKIRMINFPQIGVQEPIWTHKDRQWQVCAPATVGGFSAVGYFFARQLHQTLDVPIGMINNAWGGSACEAWIRRDILAKDETYKPMMDRWAGIEANYPKAKEEYATKLAEWKVAAEKAKAENKPAPPQPGGNPDGQMNGNSRPANIYNGVLKSHLGYGIKGAIWYQGESNASRAYQYRTLFPLMIKSWRDEWGNGDFPFYWVQLADFMAEKPEPADSSWAELREAQTMTMKALPNTGEAVIIDIGEGKDIHPKNKVDVGRRLARWALAEDYKVAGIPNRSPLYKSMEKQGSKAVLTFDNVTNGWRPFDTQEPRGFAIAGEDKKFVWASAKILPDGRIEVWSDAVKEPHSVRYAWADNPVCNMFNGAGLPLTPFRTDNWPGVTIDSK